jgi:hypothetical protein
MTDATAAEILRELRDLRRMVEALAPPALDARQRELLEALADVYGTAPFTAAEALAVAAVPLGDRKRLQAALRAAGAVSAQSAGMVFASIAKRSAAAPMRLVKLGTEGGSRLWSVECGD